MTRASLVMVATLLSASFAGAQETWETYAARVREILAPVRIAGKPLATPDPVYAPENRVIHTRVDRDLFPIPFDESEWRSRLNGNEYEVICGAETERPFTSPLNDVHERGIFYSRATGQPLFSSDDKFDSGSGWPSFTKPITPDAVVYIADDSFFMQRIEVVDSLSGAHLGHVFNDGPSPTGQRYCINGTSLIFVPEGEEAPELLVP